jgi:hypothetical protein
MSSLQFPRQGRIGSSYSRRVRIEDAPIGADNARRRCMFVGIPLETAQEAAAKALLYHAVVVVDRLVPTAVSPVTELWRTRGPKGVLVLFLNVVVVSSKVFGHGSVEVNRTSGVLNTEVRALKIDSKADAHFTTWD